MPQSDNKSFLGRLIVASYSLPLGLALIGVAAGCAFAPTGDVGRDQARVIAAGKNADVAEQVREAQDANEAEERDNADDD